MPTRARDELRGAQRPSRQGTAGERGRVGPVTGKGERQTNRRLTWQGEGARHWFGRHSSARSGPLPIFGPNVCESGRSLDHGGSPYRSEHSRSPLVRTDHFEAQPLLKGDPVISTGYESYLSQSNARIFCNCHAPFASGRQRLQDEPPRILIRSRYHHCSHIDFVAVSHIG